MASVWEGMQGTASVVVPTASALWYFIRQMVRAENEELLQRINGTYVRSAGSKLTGDEIGRRLDNTEKRVDALDAYTHEGIHEVRNTVTGIQMLATMNNMPPRERA